MNSFLIPKDRENLNNKEFSRQIENKRASKKLSQDVLYGKLKYKIIKFCSTWGMGIAIFICGNMNERMLNEMK